MKKGIVIIHLVSLLFICCNRDRNINCSDSNTVKLPQKALDLFFFKAGTWWVYECEQTKEQDSLWVVEGYLKNDNWNFEKKQCKCGYGLCGQDAFTKIMNLKNINTHNGAAFYHIYHPNIQEVDPQVQLGESIVRDYHSSDSNSIDCMRLSFEENIYDSTLDKGLKLMQIDSINVKGTYFKDILLFKYPTINGFPDWFSSVWYARYISVVRYVKNDQTVWNLVKYRIVK